MALQPRTAVERVANPPLAVLLLIGVGLPLLAVGFSWRIPIFDVSIEVGAAEGSSR